MQGGWPAVSIWVHPTGKEIWISQAAKAAPPAPVAAKPPPVHPDIEELQIYVSQYSARKADMIRKALEIEKRRSSLSKEQYFQLRKEWWRDQQSWDQQLDDIMEKIIPNMTDDLTSDEKEKKQTEIDRLDKIQVDWEPDDVRDKMALDQ